MADDCSRLWHLSESQLLANFAALYPQVQLWQLYPLRKQMRCALTSSLLTSASRPELQYSAPNPWTIIGIAGKSSAWPTMSTRTCPRGTILSPCSKSLVKDTETDACPPRNNPIKSRTAEDGIRAVGQAFARLGAPYPRKYAHGYIDFRIQTQIKAHKKHDDPPRRVKLVPITIISFIVAQAFGATRSDEEMAVADMIVIAFFFLLRPGEYTGTISDDTAFRLQDVGLYIQGRKLDLLTASDAELKITTSASYTFTRRKMGIEIKK
jgi:hypothetical protein